MDEQMGFIKFGSRVDVYLPVGTEVLIEMDQKSNRQSNAYSPFVKMSIRKHIPNTITCLEPSVRVCRQCYGLARKFLSALIWIIIAASLISAMAFAARLLKAYSPMGKELIPCQIW